MVGVNTISNVLNIREGEKYTVFLFLCYSFFIGLGLYIYYTAATTLFLTKFDGSMLPIAYIAGGLFLYLIATSNTYLQKYIKFKNLSIFLISSLSLSLLVLLVCYGFSDSKLIVFLLYLWIRANLFVFSFTFWVSASRIFNLGQAKRLYSLIGVGEVLASIVANFLVKFLISSHIVRVETLLYIALFFIIFSIYFLVQIIKNNKNKLSFKKTLDESIDNTPTNLSRKYTLLMYALGLLPIACLYIIEFSFSIDSKSYFPDKEQLAIFLGQFLFICSIIELLVKGLLFQFVTKTYGLMSGLIVMPVSLILISILIFVMGGLNIKFFFLVLISRFLITSIRRSFSDTSYQLLYQPIPGKQSIKLQNQVETYAKPMGYVVAGIVLSILININLSGTLYVYLFLLLFLITWAVLAFVMQKEYKATLLRILYTPKEEKEISCDVSSTLPDKTKNYLNDRLDFGDIVNLAESSNTDDRKKAAYLLANSGRYYAYKLLIKLLEDKSVSVRLAAIQSAPKVGRTETIPYLLNNLSYDELKAPAESSLCEMGEPCIDYISNYANTHAHNVNLLKTLIDISKSIGGQKATRFLRSKLTHDNNEVVRSAIKALISIQYKPNSSEVSYFMEKIDSIIKTYLWLLSAEIDINNPAIENKLIVSLKKERKQAMSQLLQILSFLRGDNQFEKIEKLLIISDSKTRSYLADLVNLLIDSEEIKARVLLLFENTSDYEILVNYQDRYPQQHLPAEQRLIGIVQKDTLSTWTKALALKQLLSYNDENAVNTIAASITSENILLSETAFFGLKTLNPARFDELTEYFRNKRMTTYSALCKKVQAYTDKYELTVNKAEALVFSNITDSWNPDHLIELTSSMVPRSVSDQEVLDRISLDADHFSGLIVADGTVEITFFDDSTMLLNAITYQYIQESVKSVTGVGAANLYLVKLPETHSIYPTNNSLPIA